jgi:hypothetical protein
MFRVTLHRRTRPETFEIVSVGAFTVRLRRADGVIIEVKRKRVEHQLPAELKVPKIQFKEISTPMGGQPGMRKKRRRKS